MIFIMVRPISSMEHFHLGAIFPPLIQVFTHLKLYFVLILLMQLISYVKQYYSCNYSHVCRKISRSNLDPRYQVTPPLACRNTTLPIASTSHSTDPNDPVHHDMHPHLLCHSMLIYDGRLLSSMGKTT